MSERSDPYRVPAGRPFDHEESSEDVLSILDEEERADPAEAVEAPPVEEAEAEAVAEPAPEPEPEPAAAAAPEPEPEPVPEHAPGGLDIPSVYSTLVGEPSGERRSVGVVVSRFNGEITTGLLQRALTALEASGVAQDAITIVPVPGAFELPLAAMALAKTRKHSCIVALGCVIRGETPHFDFVAGEAASGLQLAALETGVPVAFGVLTCETLAQARERLDRAADSARAALEMADLLAQLRVHAQSGAAAAG